MADENRTPWHLWVVGGLSLLWNGFGAYDFVMTITQAEAYFRASGFDQAMIDYFNAMPKWMYVPWTLGVWGGLAGSILLLVRNRWAVWALGLSFVGALVSLLHGLLINPMPPLPEALAMMQYMPWVILLITALLFWYAWTMRGRGVLH